MVNPLNQAELLASAKQTAEASRKLVEANPPAVNGATIAPQAAAQTATAPATGSGT